MPLSMVNTRTFSTIHFQQCHLIVQRAHVGSRVLFQQLRPGQLISKINHHSPTVLTRGDDASIVELGAEDPTCRPSSELDDTLARSNVVSANAGVVAATDYPAIRAVKMQRPNEVAMALELSQQLSRRCVELVDDLIVASSEDGQRVEAELNTRHPSIFTGKLLDATARNEIPELGNPVARCRHRQISSKLHCIHGSAVAAQSMDWFSSLPIPQTYGCVFGTRNDMLLVKAYVQNTSLVISNTSGWFPVGFDIPYDTGTV